MRHQLSKKVPPLAHFPKATAAPRALFKPRLRLRETFASSGGRGCGCLFWSDSEDGLYQSWAVNCGAVHSCSTQEPSTSENQVNLWLCVPWLHEPPTSKAERFGVTDDEMVEEADAHGC